MKKHKRSDGERTREQSLKHELRSMQQEMQKMEREFNKAIAEKDREIRQAQAEAKSLRKDLGRSTKENARIDLDRYERVREIVQEYHHGEEFRDEKEMLETLKHEWTCHQCYKGYLEYVTYPRAGEIWYRRECNMCEHSTKGQVYTPTVRGIQRIVTKPPAPLKFGGRK